MSGSHQQGGRIEFQNWEDIFYYREAAELPHLVGVLLADEALRLKVARAGQAKVLSRRTYSPRAPHILECVRAHRAE